MEKLSAQKRNARLQKLERLRQTKLRVDRQRGIQRPPLNKAILKETIRRSRIADAFADYQLDPSKSEDWRRLTVYLAFVVYGRRPGAPRKWTLKESKNLLAAVQTVQKERKCSERKAVCELVVSDKDYQKFTPENLRYGLRRAKKQLAKKSQRKK